MSHWRNRIIESGDADPAALLSNPLNWRLHPDSQREALAQVLDKVGWVQRVIVNKTTGFVVDGHLRVALAIQRGEKSVPVDYVELSEDEEKLVLASLDWIAGLAEADAEQMAALLVDIGEDEGIADLIESIKVEFPDLSLPDLDDLENSYGELAEDEFWPVIRLKVSPETKARYDAILATIDGETEQEKFESWVNRETLRQ